MRQVVGTLLTNLIPFILPAIIVASFIVNIRGVTTIGKSDSSSKKAQKCDKEQNSQDTGSEF